MMLRTFSANAANEMSNKVSLTSRAAATIAGLPGLRAVVESGGRDDLAGYLLPLKSRLGIDLLQVADLSGRGIGAAQDFRDGEVLPPELVRRAGIRAEGASG